MSRCDWKLSNFCSRHTVGVAGDDIMFHILVPYLTPGHVNKPTFQLFNFVFPASIHVAVSTAKSTNIGVWFTWYKQKHHRRDVRRRRFIMPLAKCIFPCTSIFNIIHTLTWAEIYQLSGPWLDQIGRKLFDMLLMRGFFFRFWWCFGGW